jgi:hypothetical protein
MDHSPKPCLSCQKAGTGASCNGSSCSRLYNHPPSNANANKGSKRDRRRRKYHTDYIDSLEQKATRLEQFIRQFTSGDPVLQPLFLEKLQGLDKSYENVGKLTGSSGSRGSISNDDDIDQLILETRNLKIDYQAEDEDDQDEDQDEDQESSVNPFVPAFQEAIENTTNQTGISTHSTPLALRSHNALLITDDNYKVYIISLFKANMAIHTPALIKLTANLESIDYNAITNPTFKLFFDVVLAIGNIYSAHKDRDSHQLYFISLAHDSLMQVIANSKLDIHLIMSLYLLSCYELTQNQMSQAYLYNSMACSLTQHMGLHISYQNKNQGNLAPKQSPFNLSVLWSICLQDRIVTNFLKVPCVIHFKRIISPFYQVVTKADNVYHLPELLFSYLTRLWYIYDRFTDQIFTVKFDIGDTNNKLKLLSMALKTLEKLRDTLPKQLNFASLNQKKSASDFYILLFHFNYQFCILKLNQIFINEDDSNNSAIIKKEIITATMESGDILSRLNSVELFINKLPFNCMNFIHSIGLMLITILSSISNNSTISSSTLRKLSGYLNIVKDILTKTAKRFKSSREFLKSLTKVAVKLHVPFTELPGAWSYQPLKSFASSSSSSSSMQFISSYGLDVNTTTNTNTNTNTTNTARSTNFNTSENESNNTNRDNNTSTSESPNIGPSAAHETTSSNDAAFLDSSKFVESFQNMDNLFQEWEAQFPTFDQYDPVHIASLAGTPDPHHYYRSNNQDETHTGVVDHPANDDGSVAAFDIVESNNTAAFDAVFAMPYDEQQGQGQVQVQVQDQDQGNGQLFGFGDVDEFGSLLGTVGSSSSGAVGSDHGHNPLDNEY